MIDLLRRLPKAELHLHLEGSVQRDTAAALAARNGVDLTELTDREEKAKGLMRAEMAKKGATCASLVAGVAAIGVDENERNLRNKVSRGKFTAGFFVRCLSALGSSSLHLDWRSRRA